MKKCCCAPVRHKPIPPQRDECPCCVEGMKEVLAQLNGKKSMLPCSIKQARARK